jgi:BirA family transcriptional regulator, biotin operon repressor / biotin---[acetyl-CoA-carboxylase] ligase
VSSRGESYFILDPLLCRLAHFHATVPKAPLPTATFSVLKLLSDREFRSGETIASALDISRGTVWNAIRAAEQAGLQMDKARGRGYRLARRIDWLDREAIEAALAETAEHFELKLVSCLDSTSTTLAEETQRGAPSGSVLIAEWQTHGRGRRARRWVSGIGEAATFSLLWRFDDGPAALCGLSLATGLAVARALEKLGVMGIALKWPNDLVWNGLKLAGILIELSGEAQGPSAAVIGVGINVRLSQATRARIDQPATDLFSACGLELDRNQVIARVLIEMAEMLTAYARQGFAPLVAEWNQRHAYHGKTVSVDSAPRGEALEGVVAGVAEDGALVLNTPSGAQRFYAGEISLRVKLA